MIHQVRTSLRAVALALALSCLPCGVAMAAEPSCCGTPTPEARQLAAALDASGVDHLWLAGRRVDWRTGVARGEAPDDGRGHTHCSAFVAAFAERQGVYVLRPPEHGTRLLANAQREWLQSAAAAAQGWRQVADMTQALALANQGRLVLAAFANPRSDKPGHIAIVRPAALSEQRLRAEGPQITQAGKENAVSTTLREGFRHHPGAWPSGVAYFVMDKSTDPARR